MIVGGFYRSLMRGLLFAFYFMDVLLSGKEFGNMTQQILVSVFAYIWLFDEEKRVLVEAAFYNCFYCLCLGNRYVAFNQNCINSNGMSHQISFPSYMHQYYKDCFLVYIVLFLSIITVVIKKVI